MHVKCLAQLQNDKEEEGKEGGGKPLSATAASLPLVSPPSRHRLLLGGWKAL